MTTTQFSFDDINRKIAVITGGASVLCGAFTRALTGVGAKIALLDINKNAAQKAAKDVAKLSGAQVIGIACDVLSKKSLEAARIQINAKFGPIDILVNGAGGNAKSATTEIEQISDMVDAPKSFYGLEIDGFNSVFNLNFIGTLLPTQILSQDMSHKKIRRCYQHFIDGGVSSAVENSCLFCSKSCCIKHHGMAGCIWHPWAFGSTPWRQGSF